MLRILQSEGRLVECLDIYQKLADLGLATLPEFKGYAMSASLSGYTSIADWIGGWVAKQGEPEFPHLMRAATLESSGRANEALGEYRLAVQAARNDETKSALARFLLGNSDLGESNSEVFLLLEGVTLNPGEPGHEALVVGLLSGVVPAGEIPVWLAKLRVHPKATSQSLVIADAIEVDRDPSAKPRLVAAMIERVYGKSLADRVLVARWLLRHGEAAQIEKILPLDQARTQPEAFALWIEGHAATGQWQEILAAIEANPVSLPAEARRLLRGQALKKTGHHAEAREEYRQLIADCGNDPSRLIPVLAGIQSDGEDEIFREGALPLLSGEESAQAVWQYLAASIQQRGDAKTLRDFLKFAAEAGPLATDSVLLDDMAYWDLVLGRPVDFAAIEQRAANFQDTPAFRFTAALSQLREGRKAQALGTFDLQKLRVRDLDPRHQLILACILAANGQTEKAARVRAVLEVSPLTKQERALLAEYVPAAAPHGASAPVVKKRGRDASP
jgi:tetratricopeptide (TPR) repeat protein